MKKVLLASIMMITATTANADVRELTCVYENNKIFAEHTILYNNADEFSTWTDVTTNKKNGKSKTIKVNPKTHTSPTSIQLVYNGIFINRVTISRETLAFTWTQATRAYPDMQNTVQTGTCTVKSLDRQLAF